jgi:hypothetical protein
LFYFDESSDAYVSHGIHEQAANDFSSYDFNGLNLLTNYPNVAYNGPLPGIGGQKLGAPRNPAKTASVVEEPAFYPYSWHHPKRAASGGVPLFNDAENLVSFVDGHASFIKIYWDSTIHYPNGGMSLAAYYDPPASYNYQWSGK